MSKFNSHREISLYSAGMYAGMRNCHMAAAANVGYPKSLRAFHIKTAREMHHVYLARMREAAGAKGYRAPIEIFPPVVECGGVTSRGERKAVAR